MAALPGQELNVGGRISFSMNGVNWHPAGEATVEEGGIEVAEVINQDGTIGRSVKSSAWMVEVTVRAWQGLDPSTLMQGTFNFSMFEQEMNRTLLLTGAFMKGRPKRKTENGDISGLTVVCAGPNGRYV